MQLRTSRRGLVRRRAGQTSPARRWSVVLLAAAASFGIPWVGCSSETPTEIVAGVTTQMRVPKDLKAVGLVLQSGGSIVYCQRYDVQVENGEAFVRLPSTVATKPVGDPKVPITISILGFAKAPTDFDSKCLDSSNNDVGKENIRILRRSRLPYVGSRILYNPMPLRQVCDEVQCKDRETCKGGLCVPADTDPTKLPEYSPSLVFGNTNTCFKVNDTAQDRASGTLGCFSENAILPVQVVDKDSCTYEVTLPESLPAILKPKGVNVRITYGTLETEILDIDPPSTARTDMEGFFIPDPARPLRFQLAPNLCQVVLGKVKDRLGRTKSIVDIAATVHCPSKTVFQPICDGDLASIQKVGNADPTQTPACVDPSADELVPTASMLYVVMDRSKSMKLAFGEEGLKRLLNLSLQDPALRSTRFAFKFVPAAANECTAAPNSFATLNGPNDVPFGDPETVRNAVASKIGDLGNVTGTDTNLFLDVALAEQGAYKALAQAAATPGKDGQVPHFNRQAVLFVGNRDLEPHCPAGDLVASAQKAYRDQRIHTYVILFPRKDDHGTPDDTSDDTYVDPSALLEKGRALANAGGTEVFNATDPKNKTVAAEALQRIVSDLSSCLYDNPWGSTGVEPTRDALAKKKVTYLSFPEKKRKDIPFAADCKDESSTASGWNWNADGTKRLRICGAACTELRDSIRKSDAFAAIASQPPPGTPLRLTEECSKE